MNPRIAFAGLFLATLLPAQRTIVVDAANGPGTDHTDLPPALAALQDGDLIVVRPGTYQGASVTTGHSFTVVGEGAATVLPAGTGPTLYITCTGSDRQRVTLAGLDLTSTSPSQWAVRGRSYGGSWPAPTLHLEDCAIRSVSTQNDQVALKTESLGVVAHRCTLDTTQVIDSMAVFVESTIQGADAGNNGPFVTRPLTALDVINSEVWVVDTTMTAGSSQGLNVAPTNCLFCNDDPFSPASQLHLCGSTQVVGDIAPGPNWPAADVIRNYSPWNPTNPTVTHEASVTFTPSPGGAVWSTGFTVVVGDVPHLSVSPAPVGGTVTCDVHGPQGELGAALLGLTASPASLFGTPVVVDLTLAVTVGSGAIGAGGVASFGLGVPNDPLLVGLVLEYTGVVLNTTSGSITLTNPGSAVVR